MCQLTDNLFQLMFVNDARLPPFDLSFLKQDQRRNTLNSVGLRRVRILIYVDFNDAHTIAHLAGKFLQYGRHHFTGAAPFGKKINQSRRFGIDDFGKGFSFLRCFHDDKSGI